MTGVAIHLAAIVGGPSWYAFFGEPPVVVASAREGTWLAPAGGIVIAMLMGLCAAYGSAAIGAIRRLPLMRTAPASIAALCLVRALVVVPLGYVHPQLRTTFELVAAIVWGAAGIGFASAFMVAWRARKAAV